MWNSKKIDLLAVRHFPLGAALLFIALGAGLLTPPTPSTAGLPEWLVRSP
jgi:hypothetical protein